MRQSGAQTSAGPLIPFSKDAKTIMRLWIVKSIKTGNPTIDNGASRAGVYSYRRAAVAANLRRRREQMIPDAALSAVR